MQLVPVKEHAEENPDIIADPNVDLDLQSVSSECLTNEQ
jgi:hypothetical protein